MTRSRPHAATPADEREGIEDALLVFDLVGDTYSRTSLASAEQSNTLTPSTLTRCRADDVPYGGIQPISLGDLALLLNASRA
jgi:hypothetical protein